MKFYTKYDCEKPMGFISNKPSMTKQSEKDSCDINKILRRYQDTGVLPQNMKNNPIYGDFTTVSDFHESLQTVALANEQFSNLPASIRDRFQNDTAKFLAFCNDSKNVSEMVKMGLATIQKNETDLKPETKIETKTETTKETK